MLRHNLHMLNCEWHGDETDANSGGSDNGEIGEIRGEHGPHHGEFLGELI